MREELARHIQQLLDDPTFQISEQLLNQIRGSIQLGVELPTTLNCREEETVRQAQRVLSQIELRLDHLVRLQHRAKRILQTCTVVERRLRCVLQEEGVLKEKVTKLQLEQVLYEEAPDLVDLQAKWKLVEMLCADAQKRLAELKSTVKLQKDLDDNLRWAQRD